MGGRERPPRFPLRKYEKAYRFSGGLARIHVDGMYGYLDRSGRLAIPNQYSAAADFDHDLAFVQMKEGSALYRHEGRHGGNRSHAADSFATLAATGIDRHDLPRGGG
jgi:hypothetical protein